MFLLKQKLLFLNGLPHIVGRLHTKGFDSPSSPKKSVSNTITGFLNNRYQMKSSFSDIYSVDRLKMLQSHQYQLKWKLA